MEVQERQTQLMDLLLVLIVELNQLVTKLDGRTNSAGLLAGRTCKCQLTSLLVGVQICDLCSITLLCVLVFKT